MGSDIATAAVLVLPYLEAWVQGKTSEIPAGLPLLLVGLAGPGAGLGRRRARRRNLRQTSKSLRELPDNIAEFLLRWSNGDVSVLGPTGALDQAAGDGLTGWNLTSDGAEWIHTVVKEKAKRAKLCMDPFHVVQWATKAIDAVRRGSRVTRPAQAGPSRPHR